MPRKPSVAVEEVARGVVEYGLPGDPVVEVAKRVLSKPKKSSQKRAAKKAAKKLPGQREKKKGKELSKVADALAGFRHASETLTEVRAVPTIFVGVDHATGVGGWPIERFSLVHGISGRGKTKFVIGLMLSFLMRDHFVDYIDAERTTPFRFVKTMMGKYADHERFFAVRPDDYEGVIARVRTFCNAIIQKKKAGEIDRETSGIIVVDSMRKLVPKDMLQEILRAAKEEAEEAESARRSGKKGGITAGKDRRAQVQAKMNAAWMDEVIPLLEKAGVAMVAIAREMEDPDAHPAMKKAGWGFKIGGGGALFYDSSLVVRVDRQCYVEEGGKGEKQEGDEFVRKKVYGEKHKVTIHKTKIAGHEDKKTVAYFHASNGVLVPEGFDRARDLLEMGEQHEVVERSGAWRSFRGQRIANGEDNAVVALSRDPETMDAIERDLRAAFAEVQAPSERVGGIDFDLETGEIFS